MYHFDRQVFKCLGFECDSQDDCSLCRRNGGPDARQTSVYYTPSEAFMHHDDGGDANDAASPWTCFDHYLEHITSNMDNAFTLSIVNHLKRLAEDATAHVKYQLFSRVVLPVTGASVLYSGGADDDADQGTSVPSQILDVFWQMTVILVRDWPICQLFLASDGFDLLLQLRKSAHWAGSVAPVVESLVWVYLEQLERQGSPESQLHRERSPKSQPEQESTPLTLLDHLLTEYLAYVLRSIRLEVPPADASGGVLGPWTRHLSTFENLEQDLKMASALWETATSLCVSYEPFFRRMCRHPLADWIVNGVVQLTVCLSAGDSGRMPCWALYAELLELLLTLSHVLDRSSPAVDGQIMAVLRRLPGPGDKLHLICELMLRSCTLERWMPTDRYWTFIK